MAAKDITKRELDNQTKQIKLLIELKGEKYNDWLYEIQQQYLNENIEVIMDSLKQEREEKEQLQSKISQIKNGKEEMINEDKEDLENHDEENKNIDSSNSIREKIQANVR